MDKMTHVKKAGKIVRMLKIGVWQRQDMVDVLWFQQQNVQHLSIPLAELDLLPSRISHFLEMEKIKKLPFAFISAISAHQIWSKSLLLPHTLSPAETQQQCQFILQQELPIDLKEIWFDYRSSTVKLGFQLEIFAIQRSVALSHLATLSPLKIQILDSQIHALIRAFEYVLQQKLDSQSVLIYQEQNQFLLLQPKAYQPQVLQQSIDNPNTEKITELYEQFCQRYEVQAEQVFVYRTPNSTQEILPAEWIELNTDLPLMALGNALWQQDPQYSNN